MLFFNAPPVWDSFVTQIFLVAGVSFAFGYYSRRGTSTGTATKFGQETLKIFVDRGKLSKLAELAETEDDFKMVQILAVLGVLS